MSNIIPSGTLALEGWTHWTVAFGTARGDVVVSIRQGPCELYQLCNSPPIMLKLLLIYPLLVEFT